MKKLRKDVLEYLKNDEKLLQFVRKNPTWYRKLTRSPIDKQALDLASKEFYQQTIPHKIEKINYSLELASMMFQMYQAMQQGD
ncbi:YlbE-like family protein [Bacillus timonensis]|nr:YlbE-like family protein [Bacillus timonensis]